MSRAAFSAVLLALLAGCSRELVCEPGQTDCGGTCYPLDRTRDHCGACGAAASPFQECSVGAFVCARDATSCSGSCTSLKHDRNNCGACGTVCGPDELCDAATAACAPALACDAPRVACEGACVDLGADRYHCGACGRACDPGQYCDAGTCRAALYVACMATSEVVPVDLDLRLAGDPYPMPAPPSDLAMIGEELYVASADFFANAAYVSMLGAGRRTELASNDLQRIVVHEDRLLVTNAGGGTLLVLDANGDLLDEIPLPDQELGANPHGVAVHGTTAWVALYGFPPSSGQKLAKVDLATGAVAGTVNLLSLPGTSSGAGLPLPDGVAADATRVYVTLKNLADDPNDEYQGMYAMPAGSGRLAVVTPGAPDAVSIVDLGADCGSPGDAVLRDGTLWITCGAFSYADLAPRGLLPVDVSGATPVVGALLPLGDVVPSKLAFCGGWGYVGDQMSENVVRFDPTGATTATTAASVCPQGMFYTSVSDVACPQ